MGVGAFLEPLVVVVLLFGGAWINRETDLPPPSSPRSARWSKASEGLSRDGSPDSVESGHRTSKDALLDGPPRSLSPSLLAMQEAPWRKRELKLLRWKTDVVSPNTTVFRGRLLSRLLRKFPFLAECWYWALIYWTYQLGRAFTAVTLQEGTVNVARKHALQLIRIEQALHIFWEVPIQRYFMSHPALMTWINWLYSFIHIPGTIAFLVWLFWFTITKNKVEVRRQGKPEGEIDGSPAGPALYEARRRTMAVCNLLAFVVFTLWPCMPPRLLSDPDVEGPIGDLSRSFGFTDTVHGAEGASSVWTSNKFCNQYAAMPSLHFGYSLMIGLTIMMIPLPPQHRRSKSIILPLFNRHHPSLAPKIYLPSSRRLACIAIGFLYPLSILIAIVSTANHFILDAVAGAMICGLGWWGNGILLNLLPLEDYFLWVLRIHKPDRRVFDIKELDEDEDGEYVFSRGVLFR